MCVFAAGFIVCLKYMLMHLLTHTLSMGDFLGNKHRTSQFDFFSVVFIMNDYCLAPLAQKGKRS